jgi:ribosomal protein S18 acetylase RimI-like enzyme
MTDLRPAVPGPTGSIEIRRLTAADWAQLRVARLAALAEAPEAFASTLDRELGFDEATWRGRLRSTAYFGAVPAGRGAAPASSGAAPRALVGLVAGFPEPGQADGWHLVSMWVSPVVRGRGVADRLVGAVCDLARTQGAAWVALWVTDVNQRALAFYRRAGFAATGEWQLVRADEPGHGEQRMVRQLV